MTEKEKDYSIFSGSRLLESMRSGGYKDTSYAVAEIVDNAIDADAKHIEILCQDRINYSTNRRSVDQIAVLDDGHGMNATEIRDSLLFGDGTRGSSPKDIGKYGMGLPNSSLSQCKRVDVYSWQNSSEPMCSHIDVDAIAKGEKEIPEPKPEKIPDSWKEAIKNFPKKSGTLVVWSKLDRCSWTKSKKIIEHSQFLIGRIYRNFLANKEVTIHMTTFLLSDNDGVIDIKSDVMLPNDPMYLMAPSSTPGHWGSEPMFKPDTEPESTHEINYNGQKHKITVKYSLEKDELRAPERVEGDQGSTKHGQHARKNQGISIVRADREIMLDDFGLPHDPRDRWWGVEVDIPSSLDLPLGLTNNKQRVDTLAFILRTVIQFRQDADSSELNQTLDGIDEEDATSSDLFRMSREISRRIRSLQNRIRAKRVGTRSQPGKSNLDKKIEGAIQHEQREGKIGQSDKDRERKKATERTAEIKDTLVSEGVEPELAIQRATEWVKEDKKIVFETAPLEGSNFFSITNTGGILRVKMNSNHRAYQNLISLTEPTEYDDLSDKQRLELTKDGLWLLLASWARYEDLLDSDLQKERVQDIRYDWGKELNEFLERNSS